MGIAWIGLIPTPSEGVKNSEAAPRMTLHCFGRTENFFKHIIWMVMVKNQTYITNFSSKYTTMVLPLHYRPSLSEI